MKLMSYDKYMKMSKPALIRKITKALRVMPKKRLAVLCYNITKSKLPRLRKRKTQYTKSVIGAYQERLPIMTQKQESEFARSFQKRRKKKRKFSRKQLAAQRLFAKRARAGTLRKRRRR